MMMLLMSQLFITTLEKRRPSIVPQTISLIQLVFQ